MQPETNCRDLLLVKSATDFSIAAIMGKSNSSENSLKCGKYCCFYLFVYSVCYQNLSIVSKHEGIGMNKAKTVIKPYPTLCAKPKPEWISTIA